MSDRTRLRDGRSKFVHFDEFPLSVMVTSSAASASERKILYANTAFEQLTGWSQAEVVGESVTILESPEADRQTLESMEQTLRAGRIWSGETVYRRKSGEVFIAKLKISPLLDSEEEITNFIYVHEDVSKERLNAREREYQHELVLQLMNSGTEGFFFLNSCGKIVMLGAAAKDIFGWDGDQILGHPLETLIPERHRSFFRRCMVELRNCDDGTRPMGARTEITGLHRDGHEFPIHATFSRMSPPSGDDGFVAVVRDLTLEKKRLAEIEESERRFRSLFELSCQFVVLLSATGRLVNANTSALSLQPILDDAGEVEFVIAEGHDITAKDKAKEQIEVREKRLANAQKMARLGDWHMDISTGDVCFSDEVYRIYGVDRENLNESSGWMMSAVHPDDRERVQAAFQAAFDGGPPMRLDHRIVRPDGDVRFVHQETALETGVDGKRKAITGIVQDVTESRAAEKALLSSNRDAQIANEAKFRFLSTIGHELRTPVNAIIGFAEMIDSEIFGPLGEEKYKEYIKDIIDSSERLKEIIDHILDAAHIDHEHISIKKEWFCSVSFLHSSVKIGEGQLKEASRHVPIELSTNDEAEILGDSAILRQSLMNIIENAYKFSPDGEKIVVAGTVNADGTYSIKVRDNGPGIPENARKLVMLPFVQADDSLTRTHEGLGLGLYLSKNFLELHGGTLEIDCPQEGGTVATITLPCSCCRPVTCS